MSQNQVFSIIRNLAMVLGSWLVGRNLFGATLTPEVWQEVVGGIILLVTLYFTWKSHELTIELAQTLILKLVMSVGTVLIASGKITGEYLTKIIGTLTVLIPIIYSIISKKKSEKIAAGDISTSKLSK